MSPKGNNSTVLDGDSFQIQAVDGSVSGPHNGNSSTQAPQYSSALASKKKGRGRTRGLRSERQIAISGKKLKVEFPPELGVAVGENRSSFVSEVGVVIRDMAPLAVKKWVDITNAQKTPMIDRLKEKFEFDMTETHIKNAVEHHLNTTYTEQRYHHHKKF